MQTDTNDLEQARTSLSALGFTGLEAEIYVFLLQESPATGYRAAQALKKPVANTYKAIQSLQKKGAVVVDEGENRLCRPIPVEELIGQISRNFKRHQERAELLLKDLTSTTYDDRIYQLQTVEQLFERCRTMLREANKVLLLNIYPLALREIRNDLLSTIRRGVEVHALIYQPTDLPNANLVIHQQAQEILNLRIGQAVTMVVDGSEILHGLLTNDMKEVQQAIWSKSTFLAWNNHRSLLSEIKHSAMISQVLAAQNYLEMRRVVTKYQESSLGTVPGFNQLAERYQGGRKAAG